MPAAEPGILLASDKSTTERQLDSVGSDHIQSNKGHPEQGALVSFVGFASKKQETPRIQCNRYPPTRGVQPVQCMQPQYTNGMERGSMNTSEAKPLVICKPIEHLPPTFFDDFPLQYTDNAHRRRHLPYGVLLQPPLRDPLKEPVATLSGEGARGVNSVFMFPTVGLQVPAISWDFPGNDGLAQQHCCVRTFGYYEICKHRSLQKKHIQVECREIDQDSRDSSYTSLTSKEFREYKLQPRCLQKRCDKYLKSEREVQIEGMCSKCKASGLTEAEIQERMHQESMEYHKETLERFQQDTDRHVQGSNTWSPGVNSVKAIGQLKSREDKEQKLAKSLGHRRQHSIFVAPWPYSPTSGLQNSVRNALQSFNPSREQHHGLRAALPYTNWGPELLTAEKDGLRDLLLGGWVIPTPKGNRESHKTAEKISSSGDSMLRLKLKLGPSQCKVMNNGLETIHEECRPNLKLKLKSSLRRCPPSSTYEACSVPHS